MPRPGQDLGALAMFAVVAEERSFTKAAVRLGVSRSAVSHAIHALEERLGPWPFVRATRAVSLTEAGQRLLTGLAPALESIDAAVLDVGELRDRPAGRIRLIAPPIVLSTLLSPKLGAFTRTYPDIVLDITSEDDTRGDLVARRKPKSPGDLTSHRCVLYRMGPEGPIYRWEFEKRGKPVSVSVSGPVIVSDAQFTIRAALDGVGLAYILEDYVADDIARGALVRVLDDWCPPFAGYFLYYLSRRHQSPALRALVAALRV